MKRYAVTITETLTRTLWIDAETAEDAEDQAKDLYENKEVVLDADDHSDTEFMVQEWCEQGTVIL